MVRTFNMLKNIQKLTVTGNAGTYYVTLSKAMIPIPFIKVFHLNGAFLVTASRKCEINIGNYLM